MMYVEAWNLKWLQYRALRSALVVMCAWCYASSAQQSTAALDNTLRQEVVTLHPVVYFDSASTDIPERYDIEPLPLGIRSASFTNLYDAYLRVLDALAEQLQQSSDHIYLHGYEERSDQNEPCSIARRRAERIKYYLVFDRGIEARRIHVLTSNVNCVPPELSARNVAQDNSEYRRVEILTSSRSPYPIRVSVARSSRLGKLFASTQVIAFTRRSAYLTQLQRRELRDFLATLPIGSQVVLSAYDDHGSLLQARNSVRARRTSTMLGAIHSERKDLRIVVDNPTKPYLPPFDLPAIDRPEIRSMSRVVILRRAEEGTR